MTNIGDQATGQVAAALRSDGVQLATLAQAPKTGTATRKFWASRVRYMQSRVREVLEISLGSERRVNYVSFETGRFPQILAVEYLGANGKWHSLTYPRTIRKKPQRKPVFTPCRLVVSSSVPRRINSAQRKGHPQHFGNAHWLREAWKVVPVNTRKIRFVIQRNHNGHPPLDHHGRRAPYSLALRSIKIGYQVLAKPDIPVLPPKNAPAEPQPWWASSTDILGSRVVYSTYTQSAEKAIDGDTDTYWRSEPQPVPFGVVPLYLDLGDPGNSNEAPVIDRFWVDPITTGVHCNLYYCDRVPDLNDFDGISDPIPVEYQSVVGNPRVLGEPGTDVPVEVDLLPTERTGVSISNAHLRLHYSHPWWVGIDARSLVAADDTQERPLISLGTVQVLQAGGVVKVLSQSGVSAEIPLDPALHGVGTQYRLVAAYYPEDPAANLPPRVRLSYAIRGYEPTSIEMAVLPVEDSDLPVKIGLHPDSDVTTATGVGLYGLVVKSESLTPEVENWFFDEGAEFVADAPDAYQDRGTAQNARLRLHPWFVSSATGNIFGIVGGDGDTFGEMEWTPIFRDYTLRRGYMNLPPTKARFWKFEMTGLQPEVYEVRTPIEREVLVFPPDVISEYQQVAGQQNSNAHPPGVGVNQSAQSFTDDAALGVGDIDTDPLENQVLVARDPQQAEQAAQQGWVWTYQPWHYGASAPRFMQAGVHRYESVRIRHAHKVAFFAALRELRPFRVDYSFGDDTPEYIEHFLDEQHLSSLSGFVQVPGEIRAISSYAEAVSGPMRSYRQIRGVQFSSQESDQVQVLRDPGFADEDLDLWSKYGDAEIRRVGSGDVEVTRGWRTNTYEDLQDLTYEELEGRIYAQMEGNTQSSGAAEGGLVSQTYTPTGAGKLTAKVRLSSSSEMSAPVMVDIVSSYDQRTLSTGVHWVQEGQTATIDVGYSPGTLTEAISYGEVETLVSTPTTYGELDEKHYYEIERQDVPPTDVYVRVRQQGQTRDTFHVHGISLYDSPIAWFFSNDDGQSWWQAIDVRSNPYGVLIFPGSDSPDPAAGRTLRWKVQTYREGVVVNALNIRPIYGNRFRSAEPIHGLDEVGPTRSLYETLPTLTKHPMWLSRSNPIEVAYVPDIKVTPVWRNLVANPSGENGDEVLWDAEGGTVESGVIWERTVE